MAFVVLLTGFVLDQLINVYERSSTESAVVVFALAGWIAARLIPHGRTEALPRGDRGIPCFADYWMANTAAIRAGERAGTTTLLACTSPNPIPDETVIIIANAPGYRTSIPLTITLVDPG